MPHEDAIEHLTYRLTEDEVGRFTAPTAGPIIVLRSGNLPTIIIAPRGGKITIKKIVGFVTAGQSMTGTSSRMKVQLSQVSFTTTSVDAMRALPTLWSWGADHAVTGTPADTFRDNQGVAIDVDFKDRHDAVLIGRPKQDNLGEVYGFAFVHDADGQDFPWLGDITVFYDLEWLENTGPSPNMNIAEIETEQY